MNKKLLLGILGIVLMTTTVSAYDTYKIIEQFDVNYLNVHEETIINELMVEENFIIPLESHARVDYLFNTLKQCYGLTFGIDTDFILYYCDTVDFNNDLTISLIDVSYFARYHN
jgi:hypothetical protein